MKKRTGKMEFHETPLINGSHHDNDIELCGLICHKLFTPIYLDNLRRYTN